MLLVFGGVDSTRKSKRPFRSWMLGHLTTSWASWGEKKTSFKTPHPYIPIIDLTSPSTPRHPVIYLPSFGLLGLFFGGPGHTFSSWRFQPLWKICSSKWESSSPIFGVKIPKILELPPPRFLTGLWRCLPGKKFSPKARSLPRLQGIWSFRPGRWPMRSHTLCNQRPGQDLRGTCLGSGPQGTCLGPPRNQSSYIGVC